MAVPVAPDWLTKHDGALKPGLHDHTLYVMIGGVLQYSMAVRPCKGKHECAVQQSVNGKRVDDSATTYPSADAALAGGLEQLRAKLGW